MGFFGCPPDVHSYNPVLISLHSFGDYDAISSLFKEMECPPNEITYNVLLFSTCKAGKFEDVGVLVDRMSQKGFKPNPIACITLFYSLCSKGEVVKAEEIWARFVGGDVSIDTVFWSALISRLCKAGKQAEAYTVFRHMVDRSLL
eukprot:c29462_g1_i1 orf=9-443(-)